ncbi:MAG: peptidoglycan DD-metalloendopeptidase family protein [Bacteroidia bacterium]|nr:peptidoglycan DD-metalloendopeptidase family protein [Bacteroidia bacterium]
MKRKAFIFFVLFLIILLAIRFATEIYFHVPVHTNERFQYDSLAVELGIFKEYGINTGNYNVYHDEVKRNENLSTIFTAYHITAKQIEELSQLKSEVFDVRKIRQGNKYTVFCSKDSVRLPEYFVYESSPVEYYVFDLRDSIRVMKSEKQIKMIRKTMYGRIKSSLWNSMTDNGIDPSLAIKLSEIYAWSIDFFDIQKGDYFKVIYDEQYVDTTYTGLGKIYCAVFNHMDKDYYAVPFAEEGVENWFDEWGNSLRKAFLKAPLKFTRISSRFSFSRLHPILKIRRPHFGVDYAAPTGTPVHAIGDGRVVKAERSGGAGNLIMIRHNSIYSTSYMHLSGFAKGVRVGASVAQGQVIGYVGSTGLATGPHLDFRFYKNGTPVDPLKVEAPSVEPVKKGNMSKFNELKENLIEQLKAIPEK